MPLDSALLETRTMLLAMGVAFNALLMSQLLWEQIPRLLKPVTWLDGPLQRYTAKLNRSDRSPTKRRARGGVITAYLIAWGILFGWAVQAALPHVPYGWVLEAAIIGLSLGWRPAWDAARTIAEEAHDRSLEEIRHRLDAFCPFDHEKIDISGVYRLTVELLARRTFLLCGIATWYLLLGLPGLGLFLATHQLARLLAQPAQALWAFGSFCRFIYGILSLIPALWSGVILTLAAFIAAGNHPFRLFKTYNAQHVISPHQHPLWLVSTALQVQLGGKRAIQGIVVDQPWIGSGAVKITQTHLRAMTHLYLLSGLCFILTVAALYYAAAL